MVSLQTEFSVNFPQENSLPPRKWQSQTASSLLMVIMWLCYLEGKM